MESINYDYKNVINLSLDLPIYLQIFLADLSLLTFHHPSTLCYLRGFHRHPYIGACLDNSVNGNISGLNLT